MAVAVENPVIQVPAVVRELIEGLNPRRDFSSLFFRVDRAPGFPLPSADSAF